MVKLSLYSPTQSLRKLPKKRINTRLIPIFFKVLDATNLSAQQKNLSKETCSIEKTCDPKFYYVYLINVV